MGEAIQYIWNALGFSSLIFGFITNWDNAISRVVGIVGVLWIIIRCGIAYEHWLEKRDGRKERRDNNKSLKKFRDLEKDEYREQP